MPDKKGLTIKKHSAMVQTNVGNLTLTQRKAINFLIYIAQRTGNQKIYQTTIANLKQVCNIASTENIAVKEQLKALTKTTIEFNYLDKDKRNVWEISTLLAGCRIVPKTGMVEFAFSPFLLEKILYPEMYAPLNLILISGLKCTYAVVLYEFLRDYLTAPAVPTLTIEDLKNLLGIDETKYKFFPNFKRNVLIPATEEVNLKTDISCRYELVKETGIRNKYSHIRFFVSKKTGNLTYEKNEDVKNESLDLSMDLFEESVSLVNKTAVQIPEDIMSAVPENQRTETLKTLLSRFLEKGNEYVISNIKYSLEHFQENFIGYLKVALENDYAGHVREAKANIKEAAVKKSRQIEQKEKAKQAVHNDHAEILKKIESLEPNKLEPIHNKFAEIIVKSGIKPEFLTDTVKESLMIEAYKALHVVNAYSAPDQD